MRLEIRIAGFGGQGIVRAGVIIGMAACIYGGRNAVQTQSYGPESRGGQCKSEVVISDEEIDFPKVIDPDVLIVMSQEAYNAYFDKVKEGGTVILDPDLIPNRKKHLGKKVFAVPGAKIAEKLGKTLVANVVMLGALTSLTKAVDGQALKKSIMANVPAGTEELNLRAFEEGVKFAKNLS